MFSQTSTNGGDIGCVTLLLQQSSVPGYQWISCAMLSGKVLDII